jgi:hypothetical protein
MFDIPSFDIEKFDIGSFDIGSFYIKSFNIWRGTLIQWYTYLGDFLFSASSKPEIKANKQITKTSSIRTPQAEGR